MTIDPKRIEMMDEQTAAIMRTLTPGQILNMADTMWRVVRGRTLRIIKREHPDWRRKQIIPEANQRMWDEKWCEQFEHKELFAIALERIGFKQEKEYGS
ncbi:MAG: hypothetical protein IIB54_05090 [Planctomycetes bacterium]|nr:hypothetical protein [Planctomycetota bacterium]